ncbi:MAG: NAD(P)-binding domain-containing protein [Planctomycetaceae bacterium]|nr:NAD(P)-binding domain-containing protein [Planctomycetaceae bacterium]
MTKETPMETIGFIGLGLMGLPMATNLVKKSGMTVTGIDFVPERTEMLVQAGGKAGESAQAIFATSSVVFMCLPTNELMAENCRMAAESAKPGTIVVDLGSTAPAQVRELYATLREKGISLLDSPVSGGDVGAKAGTLAIMCGGDKETFDRVEPLLLMMGKSVTYMGATGNGSAAKLANNMIVAINLSALGEAFAYAVKAGLDPQVLFNAIRGGFAGSPIMDLKAPKLIAGDYTPSARMAVHHKDIRNAAKLAKEMGVSIPLSQVVLDQMDEIERLGLQNEDQCAMAKLYERDMGVSICGKK